MFFPKTYLIKWLELGDKLLAFASAGGLAWLSFQCWKLDRCLPHKIVHYEYVHICICNMITSTIV